MSVTPNNIVAYGSANMPEADGLIVGGAVDFTKRVAFYDLSPAGTVDVVSSSPSDSGTKMQVTGRDATGVIQTPTAVTLNGTTPVPGSQGFERLLAAVITGGAIGSLSNPGGTAALGDVAVYAHTPVVSAHTMQTGSANTSGATPPIAKLQSGDGATVAAGQIIRITSGTGANQLRQIIATSGYGADVVAVSRDWTTLPDATSVYSILQGMLFESSPNAVVAITRCFSTAAADIPGGAQRVFYEKIFVVNNNSTTSLTGAQVEIASEAPTLPSGALLDLALCTALADGNTTTNRQTAPTSGAGSFVTQPALVSVPGAGNLPSGAAPNGAGAQGVWLRLTLPAGAAAYKGSADLRVQGTTT
ncbi:MAG TPA: hypothetical protein VGM07_10925 [Stellaceae bacterium]|jgi:hypothetical protein